MRSRSEGAYYRTQAEGEQVSKTTTNTHRSLDVIADNDDLVLVVVSKEVAELLKDWSGTLVMRLGQDSRHPRLRRLLIKPQGGEPSTKGKTSLHFNGKKQDQGQPAT